MSAPLKFCPDCGAALPTTEFYFSRSTGTFSTKCRTHTKLDQVARNRLPRTQVVRDAWLLAHPEYAPKWLKGESPRATSTSRPKRVRSPRRWEVSQPVSDAVIVVESVRGANLEEDFHHCGAVGPDHSTASGL